LNTTPCWSTMKYEVATGTVTEAIRPSQGLLLNTD
jgi:hypothetical protein